MVSFSVNMPDAACLNMQKVHWTYGISVTVIVSLSWFYKLKHVGIKQ